MSGDASNTGELAQTIGRLLAYAERAEQDRREINGRLDKFSEGQDALRGDVRGLAQTQSGISSAVTEIAREKLSVRIKQLEDAVFSEDHQAHGERLTWVEGKVQAWDKAIGNGRALLFKIILTILGSSVFAGIMARALAKLGF